MNIIDKFKKNREKFDLIMVGTLKFFYELYLVVKIRLRKIIQWII